MTHRVVYSVVHRNDEWHVLKDNDLESQGRFGSKSDAVEFGRDLAMREEQGQLRVAAMDGSVQSESTFGKDPDQIEGKQG